MKPHRAFVPDPKLVALREAGYAGWIDQNGDAVDMTDPYHPRVMSAEEIAAAIASPDGGRDTSFCPQLEKDADG